MPPPPKLKLFTREEPPKKTPRQARPNPVLPPRPTIEPGEVTVSDVFAWFAHANPSPSKCVKAQRERERLYGRFADSLGDRLCTELKPHDLLGWINQFAGENGWTRRRWSCTIQKPFNAAAVFGFISHNPFLGLRFPAGENGRDWTDQEYRDLLRFSAPHFRRLLIFIRFSGMRSGECRSLQWSNIKLEGNVIVLESHKTMYKTGTARRVPMNNVMFKLLVKLRRMATASQTHVFLNTQGRPWSSRGLVKAMQLVRDRAGLDPSVRLHGGRHYFCTRAILNKIDIATLAEIIGHKNISMTQRYVHLAGATAHLNAAMEQAVKARPGEPTATE
jgi:integrase